MSRLIETAGRFAGHDYVTQTFMPSRSSRVIWTTAPPPGTKVVIPGMDWGDGDVDPDEEGTVSGVVVGGKLGVLGSDGCESAYHPSELREPTA